MEYTTYELGHRLCSYDKLKCTNDLAHWQVSTVNIIRYDVGGGDRVWYSYLLEFISLFGAPFSWVQTQTILSCFGNQSK